MKKEKLQKEVKMHKFLVCAFKSQVFAQSISDKLLFFCPSVHLSTRHACASLEVQATIALYNGRASN